MEQKIDLLVSFDTTGSMYPVLAQVRREVEQFVKTMFTEFTDLRLGVIAHGDYCDKDNPYTIRVMDFTRDEKRLCKFVKETDKTFGGDADECYELVLHTAHEDLQWREDAEHIMIVIGDASPHAPSYPQNKLNLDWKEEADKLRKIGVKIFSVHALAGYRSSSRGFYKSIAETTNGVYLTLDMFNEIVDLIKATCYQQGGEEKLNEFVTIIKDSGRMTRSMENNFKRLRGEEVEDTYEVYRRSPSHCTSARARAIARRRSASGEPVSLKTMDRLTPVIPGRFQIMTVDENCAIKEFVESNGITFKKGRGFYELSKAETVQQYKEVIMMDRETGEMFNGSQVREELGLQPQSEKGGVNERLHKDATKKFRVFVQSTSVNRKLIAGTTFLYEVDDLEDAGTIISEVEVKSTGDVKKPVKVEKKTSTEPKLDTIDGKFDVELCKKSIKKADEPVVDTMILKAASDAKKKKTSKKSLKELEKEHCTVTDKIYAAKTKKDVRKVVDDSIDRAAKDTTPETLETFCDAVIAAEVKEEILDREVAKKKSKKAVKKETTRDMFTEIDKPDYIESIEVDRDKIKVDVDKSTKKSTKNSVDKHLEKVNAQILKATDAVGRFEVSKNKKNTTYLKNNLEKLIKDAQSLLDSIE